MSKKSDDSDVTSSDMTPSPVTTSSSDARPAPSSMRGPGKTASSSKATLGQMVFFRDENEVVSAAHVTGVADDGSLFLHVLYRDGIAGTFDRSGQNESVDGGVGWFLPSKGV